MLLVTTLKLKINDKRNKYTEWVTNKQSGYKCAGLFSPHTQAQTQPQSLSLAALAAQTFPKAATSSSPR